MPRLYSIFSLVKFRLSLAVTFSAVTGFLVYNIHPLSSLLLLVAGVFLLSCGAAALNQFTERDPDSKMKRTMLRPIPDEKIEPEQALIIAVALIFAGSLLLVFTGVIPALLGLLTVFLYNFVYTPLKKVSWAAVLPGALVGAIPPLIGFTAAGGRNPSGEIIIFSSFMFLWQLPHFWLIIIRYRNDYKLAGFKTMPGGFTENYTRLLVFVWVIITSGLLGIFSVNELVFNRMIAIILVPVNIVFILLFYRSLFISPEEKSARGAFILINSFSLLIMILFIVNSFLR